MKLENFILVPVLELGNHSHVVGANTALCQAVRDHRPHVAMSDQSKEKNIKFPENIAVKNQYK